MIAYVIFETLNTRGKDLTLSDLVKSHLSRLLKPTNKGVDLARDQWEEIAKTFEESQADISVSTLHTSLLVITIRLRNRKEPLQGIKEKNQERASL